MGTIDGSNLYCFYEKCAYTGLIAFDILRGNIKDIRKGMAFFKKTRQSTGALQRQVERNIAPKSIDRVDKGRGQYEKDHVHFKDGSALNYDGSWKHGGKQLTRDEIQWIKESGGTPPPQG